MVDRSAGFLGFQVVPGGQWFPGCAWVFIVADELHPNAGTAHEPGTAGFHGSHAAPGGQWFPGCAGYAMVPRLCLGLYRRRQNKSHRGHSPRIGHRRLSRFPRCAGCAMVPRMCLGLHRSVPFTSHRGHSPRTGHRGLSRFPRCAGCAMVSRLCLSLHRSVPFTSHRGYSPPTGKLLAYSLLQSPTNSPSILELQLFARVPE